MAKDNKSPTEPETLAPGLPSADAPTASGGQTITVNTLQRASTVIRQLKLAQPVASGVLAQHGLTRLSMVDPVAFKQQVTDWLASPAQK